MKKYKVFRFIEVRWLQDSRTIEMKYGFDNELIFTDQVVFEFEPTPGYHQALLERVIRSLWLVNGVSYYKAALTPEIDAQAACLTEAEASFLNSTYRFGLGQLCYEHKIPFERLATFAADPRAKVAGVSAPGLVGSVVGLGGGKDSLVTTTLLESMNEEFATFSATYMPEENDALLKLAGAIGHQHLTIRRRFDTQLADLNRQGAYNGHVPVTAIITLIGLAAAALTGRQQVVMSNEASAGEGNAHWDGVEVNHQYSKTFEYEKLLAGHVATSISPDLRTFSLLRPLGELQIARLFAHGPMQRYRGLYSSCNRNFKADAQGFGFCGNCSKCAFVYLILTPFVPKLELKSIFGADLLAQASLAETFKELFGLAGHKPFECVGEIEECRAAATLAAQSGDYPELASFGVPETDYDFSSWQPHLLPKHYAEVVKAAIV
jgi:hypothetical protein